MMAKRSLKRTPRRERDHNGCMWGLICLFDFRIGRSTRRLLSDRRCGSSRHVAGTRNSKRSVGLLTYGDDRCEDPKTSTGSSPDDDEIQIERVESIRISIKALLDEEMSNRPHSKDQTDISLGDHLERNQRKENKTCKVSCNQEAHNATACGSLESHSSGERFPETEKLCCQNHQHLEMHLNNMNETDSCSTQNIPVCIEGNVPAMHLATKEAILREKDGMPMESILMQKFIDAKELLGDELLVQSKEFMDAIKIMNLNKELFLKLMQDPNSFLAKHIQELQDAEARVKLDKEKCDPVQCAQMVSHKQARKQNIQSFFRRKEKEKCKQGSVGSPASRGIVISKPDSPSISNSTSAASPSSSPRSHLSLRNKVESEAAPSYFSLREIKRKWKHITGESRKEQHRISMDGILHKIPYGQQDQRDLGKERQTSSLHNERTTKPSASKKKEKTDKQKESSTNHDVALPGLDTCLTTIKYAHQREADIYEQAKKHLAEMLNNGDEDGESPTKHVPRTLGRILSLPEYMSPRTSPRKDEEPNFLPAQMENSPNENLHCDSEKVEMSGEEDAATHLSNLSCIADMLALNDHKQEDDEAKLSNFSWEELPFDAKMQESVCIEGNPCQKGGLGFEEMTDEWIEKTNPAAITCELDSCISNADNHQSTDKAENYEGEEYSECQILESSVEKCQQGSPSGSLPGSPLDICKTEDPDIICEKAERASPVSVLEPFYIEDVIGHKSPAATRDELPMPPRKIHFKEENDSALNITPSDPEIHSRTCGGEKKSELEYVKAVLDASGLTCQEVMGKCLYSDQLLDPSLFEEVEASSTQSSDTKKLLFDCINEVLMEVYKRFYGCSPWVSFIKPSIQTMPPRSYVLQEVWKGIDWHLLQQVPCKLDQIIGKDMAKAGRWMDLRTDVETIGMEIEDAILDELIEETIYEVLN